MSQAGEENETVSHSIRELIEHKMPRKYVHKEPLNITSERTLELLH